MTEWSQVQPLYRTREEDLTLLTTTKCRRKCWSSWVLEKANITSSGTTKLTGKKEDMHCLRYQRCKKLVSPRRASLPFCRSTSLPVLAPRMDISWIQTKVTQFGLLLVNDFHTRTIYTLYYFFKRKCIFSHINHIIITSLLYNLLSIPLHTLLTPATLPLISFQKILIFLYNSMNYGHRERVRT